MMAAFRLSGVAFLGHAAEPLEGVDVASEEGLLLLIEDHFTVSAAGVP